HAAPRARAPGGDRLRAGLAARAASLLRHGSARGRRRLARRPGHARARGPRHHADLHPREPTAPARDRRAAPSARWAGSRGHDCGPVNDGSALAALRLSPDVAALVAPLLREAERRGLAMYLVGGPVRDLLLRQALRDVDLIVDSGSCSAEELARAAAPAGGEGVGYDRLGTVRLPGAPAPHRPPPPPPRAPPPPRGPPPRGARWRRGGRPPP